MSNDFSFSAAESQAFGFRIFRAKLENGDPRFLTEHIEQEKPDILISRIDVKLQKALFSILRNFPESYLADTLVYYAGNVKDATLELPNGVEIRQAGIQDEEIISGLIKRIFSGYENHYHSSPIFNKVNLAQGYMEWTQPYLRDSDKCCFMILDNGVPAGFLTARIDAENSYADIILNGVLKEYEGQGKYSFLIRHLKKELFTTGIKKVMVSTQLNNQRVQSVWMKEGMYPYQSFYTFHHYISEKAKQAINI